MLTSTAIARSAATALADGGTAKDRAFLPASPTRRFDAILHVIEIVLKDMSNADPATRVALGRLTEALARIVNLPAQPQESLKDFTRRLAAHMDILPPSARALIEKQLNQQSLLVALRFLIETLRPALSIDLPADLPLPHAAHPDVEPATEHDGPAFRQPTIQVPLPTRPLFSQAPGVAPGAPHLQQALGEVFSPEPLPEPQPETGTVGDPVPETEEPLPTFREAAAFLASDAQALAQAVAIVRRDAADVVKASTETFPPLEDPGSSPDALAPADADPSIAPDERTPDQTESNAPPVRADLRTGTVHDDGTSGSARLPGSPSAEVESHVRAELGSGSVASEPDPDAARSPASGTERPLSRDAPAGQGRQMGLTQDPPHPAPVETADRTATPPTRSGLPAAVPGGPSALQPLPPPSMDPTGGSHRPDLGALPASEVDLSPAALAAETEHRLPEPLGRPDQTIGRAVEAALLTAGTMEVANTIAQLDEWETLFYMLAGNIAETPEPGAPEAAHAPQIPEEETGGATAASTEPALDLLTLGEDEARDHVARLPIASDDSLPAGSVARGTEAPVMRDPVGFAFVPYLPTEARVTTDIDEDDGLPREADDPEEDHDGDHRHADDSDEKPAGRRETLDAAPVEEDEETESLDAYDLYQRLSDLP